MNLHLFSLEAAIVPAPGEKGTDRIPVPGTVVGLRMNRGFHSLKRVEERHAATSLGVSTVISVNRLKSGSLKVSKWVRR
ncbi:MAG: hypothetical protein IID38_08755 [Planctomycetes bacterium]|nr:hypothetical protein [Planctomycetota bacterium]